MSAPRLMLRERRDAGLTLVELIVAMSLSIIALVMVGSFMISSFTTQQQVTTIAQATSHAQLTVQLIENDLRNASALHVGSGSTTDSQVLIARVRTGTGGNDWECSAWYYHSETGTIMHATADDKNDWPWGPDLLDITNWIELGKGLVNIVDVGQILGDTFDWLFGGSSASEWKVMAAGVRNDAGPGGVAVDVFTAPSQGMATIQFAVEAGDSTPVVMHTSVAVRQPAEDEGCFDS